MYEFFMDLKMSLKKFVKLKDKCVISFFQILFFLFYRCLSSLQEERVRASSILNGPDKKNPNLGGKFEFVEKIRKALYASKIVSYAQGFMLLREAAENFGWKLNYGGIALMWRGGCIIRSAFLGKIKLVNITEYSLN